MEISYSQDRRNLNVDKAEYSLLHEALVYFYEGMGDNLFDYETDTIEALLTKFTERED